MASLFSNSRNESREDLLKISETSSKKLDVLLSRSSNLHNSSAPFDTLQMTAHGTLPLSAVVNLEILNSSESGTANQKKNKRIVSLDSSLSMMRVAARRSPQLCSVRSLSSNSVSATNTNVMQRLDFETVEVGNTPLSSMRSCSEFNRNNSNTTNKNKSTSEKSKTRSSFLSRLFPWNKAKSNQINTSKLDVDEQRFMMESLRPCPTGSDLNPRPTLFSDSVSGYQGHNISQTFEYRDSKLSDYSNLTRNSRVSRHARGTVHVSNNKSSGGAAMYETTSLALDIIFGYKSRGPMKMPMEIELKVLNFRDRSDSDHRESINGAYPARLSLYNPWDGDAADHETYLHISRPSTPLITTSSTRSSDEDSESGDFDNNIVGEVTTVRQESRYDVRSLIPVYFQMLSRLANFCTKFIIINETGDQFYDTIRVQPFGSGAYLRGMLLAGFVGTFFHAYNLLLWPDIAVEGYLHIAFESILFGVLSIQLAISLIMFPIRISIHFCCWESSRCMDADSAIEILRSMLHSDNWTCSRGMGRVLDGLSILVMLISEAYLWLTPADDLLRGLIVSLAATNLLVMAVRIAVATVFSLSMHDPEILNDARRRGLSRLDMENLPTFVFTNLDEVNNIHCPICLCNFEMGEMLISLRCDKKHSFHAGCIRQWLQRQNSCPLCQKMV